MAGLVGDSPELMPVLDNRLLSYFEHSIKQHCTLTRANYPSATPNASVWARCSTHLRITYWHTQ